MAHKCPSCSADVPGVVTQATLEERLSAKSSEISMLRTELATKADKADRFDAVEAQRAQLASEILQLREGAARRATLAEIGVTDDATIDGFASLYSSHVAGLGEEERPTFSDWVSGEEGAKTNPLLARFYQSTEAPQVPGAETQPATTPAQAVAPPTSFPATNTGARTQPPTQPAKMTPAQLRAFFQNKTPAEVSAWRAQHGAAYGWAPEPAKQTNGSA